VKKLSYLFIVNPVAGNHKAKETIETVKVQLKRYDIDYTIKYTTHKGGATDLLKNLKGLPYDVVVAVGGDGTVNEVINSMVGTDKIIGIIPCGTGNDLAKSLNIPRDPCDALDILVNGEAVGIDIGRAGHRYFTNVASIGLDAEIAYCANRMKKKLSGTKAYFLALLKVLISFKSFPIVLEQNGTSVNKDVMLVAVCNGKYYGGGMKIAPDASILDGMLDICLIEKMSKLRLLFLFPTVYKGSHNKFVEVKFYRTDKLIIKSPNLLLNLDGEISKRTEDVEFTVINNQIKVILKPQCIDVLEDKVDFNKVEAPAS